MIDQWPQRSPSGTTVDKAAASWPLSDGDSSGWSDVPAAAQSDPPCPTAPSIPSNAPPGRIRPARSPAASYRGHPEQGSDISSTAQHYHHQQHSVPCLEHVRADILLAASKGKNLDTLTPPSVICSTLLRNMHPISVSLVQQSQQQQQQ